jgi:hypothetical protein
MKVQTPSYRRTAGVAISRLAAAVLLTGWLLGCSSNKIVMRPGSTQVGAGVDENTGALKNVSTRFQVTDDHVVAWAEFNNAFKGHTARFQWFNPEELLVLDSGPIPIVTDDQLYAWRRVWSVMPIKDSAAVFTPGTWRVDIYFDQKRIRKHKFVIQES